MYAQQAGSEAAPTAGLHFTDVVRSALRRKGVQRADVVLHVGAGTFRPMSVADPREHVMHEAWFSVPSQTADVITRATAAGGAVWAVGTTSVRAVGAGGRLSATDGETSIFIHPPYRFQFVDHLLTNLHLPKSTLVMLVAARAWFS